MPIYGTLKKYANHVIHEFDNIFNDNLSSNIGIAAAFKAKGNFNGQ